jgi:hypothetical protein
MITENNPKVKKVIGKAKNAITGRTKALSNPKTMAEINAF